MEKKKKKKGDAKVEQVMREFKNGTLRSSSGHIVTDRDQALAIAMSEAGLSKAKQIKHLEHLTGGYKRDLQKAVGGRYKKRWKGPDGKWHYDYGTGKGKPGSKADNPLIGKTSEELQSKQKVVAQQRQMAEKSNDKEALALIEKEEGHIKQALEHAKKKEQGTKKQQLERIRARSAARSNPFTKAIDPGLEALRYID